MALMTNREREKYLEYMDCKYGHGNYIGGDGAKCIGIVKFHLCNTQRRLPLQAARRRGNREEILMTRGTFWQQAN